MKLTTNRFLPDVHRIVNENDEFVGLMEVDTCLPQGLLEELDDESFDSLSFFLNNNNKVVYLANIEIYDEYRRRGYAKKALELLDSKMKDEGYEYIILTPVPSEARYVCDDVKDYWNLLNEIYSKHGYKVLMTFDYESDYSDCMHILYKELG